LNARWCAAQTLEDMQFLLLEAGNTLLIMRVRTVTLGHQS
jgi:hypothetical protein